MRQFKVLSLIGNIGCVVSKWWPLKTPDLRVAYMPSLPTEFIKLRIQVRNKMVQLAFGSFKMAADYYFFVVKSMFLIICKHKSVGFV